MIERRESADILAFSESPRVAPEELSRQHIRPGARRVVVTGIGAITPIGFGRHGLWEGVRRGSSAVRAIQSFDATPFRSRIAAEIRDFDPLDFLEPRRARRLDRFAQLSIAASRQALDDADLSPGRHDLSSFGVYLGSALGGIAFAEEQHVRFLDEGIHAVAPTLALAVFGGAGATNVAMDLGLRGPVIGNANSCASGLIAIGEAFHAIRYGRADRILAGGAEAPLAPLTFGAFARIKALSTRNHEPERASRPFDVERDGFVMGEGSAVLVLEDLDLAIRRGARPLAEILGYAVTNDAYHMIVPLPSATEAARAVVLALADARIRPSAIEYLNAHATGTPLGDAAEALAIQKALGDDANRVPVSSTKGITGHPLGASGAIETAITILALRHRWLPATANLERVDPSCQLRHVPPGGVEVSARVAAITSFGFGGINACLVVRRWDREEDQRVA